LVTALAEKGIPTPCGNNDAGPMSRMDVLSESEIQDINNNSD
jgi:hypothetical protein